MKYQLIIILLLAGFVGFSQNEFELKTDEEGKVFYQGIIKAETQLSTKGQRSDKSKEYFYTFTHEITLEFKDDKVRYTLDNFKKKSSPGEPGSTLEAFIDSYNPTISSESTRAKAAQRLDKMEIVIQDHVDNTIVRLKDTFDPSEDSDW